MSILLICDKIWNQLVINKLLNCRLLFDNLSIHSRVTFCYIRLICTFYSRFDCFETKIHISHRCQFGCWFAILVGENLVILCSQCHILKWNFFILTATSIFFFPIEIFSFFWLVYFLFSNWKGYLIFPNLLEITLLHQIFVYWFKDFKFSVLVYLFDFAKLCKVWPRLNKLDITHFIRVPFGFLRISRSNEIKGGDPYEMCNIKFV